MFHKIIWRHTSCLQRSISMVRQKPFPCLSRISKQKQNIFLQFDSIHHSARSQYRWRFPGQSASWMDNFVEGVILLTLRSYLVLLLMLLHSWWSFGFSNIIYGELSGYVVLVLRMIYNMSCDMVSYYVRDMVHLVQSGWLLGSILVFIFPVRFFLSFLKGFHGGSIASWNLI